MTVNWQTLIRSVETTIVSAVAAFLASIGTTTGGSFDAKHLEAAGLGALIALGYRLAAVVSTALAPPTVAGPATPPLPVAGPAPLAPGQVARTVAGEPF